MKATMKPRTAAKLTKDLLRLQSTLSSAAQHPSRLKKQSQSGARIAMPKWLSACYNVRRGTMEYGKKTGGKRRKIECHPGQGHLLRVMKLGNVVRVRVLLFAVRSVCGVWLPVAHGGSFKASLTSVFSVNTKTVSTMISNFTIPKILIFFSLSVG